MKTKHRKKNRELYDNYAEDLYELAQGDQECIRNLNKLFKLQGGKPKKYHDESGNQKQRQNNIYDDKINLIGAIHNPEADAAEDNNDLWMDDYLSSIKGNSF